MNKTKKSVLTLVTLIVLLTLSTTVALADPDDYNNNPGLQQASPSGQYHGAFQYYAHESGGWIPGAAQQGGIGDTTGPANSAGAPWGAQNP
jgi:hypothetical protein